VLLTSYVMLGLGRVLGAGISALFIAISSCGGSAFSVATDSGGPDLATGDAPAQDAKVASDGSTENWCLTQGTHTFCEDFSEGVPGQLMSGTTSGASLVLDTTTFPPGAHPAQSMAATTPALVNVGDSAAAIGTISFPDEDGSHDVLQADLDVASSCFDHGDKDGVTVLALSFVEHYLLAVVVASDTTELLEVTLALDGGVSNAAVHLFSTTIPLDKWGTVNVDANLGTGTAVSQTATVKVNDLVVLSGVKLSLVPVLGAHHPTLGLGASVKDALSISSGCKVNVDEVFLDINLM
jgi:hypothetical protein